MNDFGPLERTVEAVSDDRRTPCARCKNVYDNDDLFDLGNARDLCEACAPALAVDVLFEGAVASESRHKTLQDMWRIFDHCQTVARREMQKIQREDP